MVSLNPRTWFRQEAPVEEKASATGYAVAAHHVGQPVWSTRDFENFANEGFVRNTIAYRCVSMVAQAVGSIPMLLHNAQGEEQDRNHPLLRMLAQPAPGVVGSELMESVAAYLQLSGNAYLEAVGPSRGQPPRELWSLRPDRMKVIPDSNAMPIGYEYQANGRLVRWYLDRSGRAVRQVGGQANSGATILHLKRFHPTDDWYGMAATEPASYAIDRHNEASRYNMAVLQNGATPSGAMVMKPVKGEGGAEQSPPQNVIEAAEDRLRNRYAGSANAGKPFVLNGNVDWIQFGMSMEALQLTESKVDAARDICVAFGVPSELLLPGESTYNNKREAKLGLYEETVLPLAEHIIEHLNGWLTPRFDEGLRLAANLDEIEALGLRREIRQKNMASLYASGLIDRNEGREALQYEPAPETVTTKVDASVVSALVQSVSVTGMDPLIRYFKSVGLYDPTMSEEEIINRATDLVSDDDEFGGQADA